MTAIVGVLNSQGIAIAADSAVTVRGNNGKKVYNRSNKIFTLSKYHPVGIAVYNNADFLGIPLETLIKLYREKVKDVPFNTLNDYKLDFIEFLKTKVNHISREYKRDAFYNFCNEAFNTVKSKIVDKLDTRAGELAAATLVDVNTIADSEILSEMHAYLTFVQGLTKSTYVSITLADYTNYYHDELINITNFIQTEIQTKYGFVTLKPDHISILYEILYSLINVEFIFERHSGLVFIGFGNEEIYPSSHLILVGTLIADIPRVRMMEIVEIQPGKLNSNILPYAQGDVTTTVLTGVDPNYKTEVRNSINSAFETISTELSNYIPDGPQQTQIKALIKSTSEELVKKLDEYQFNTLTGPLLDILANMGKEDMSELAESLVNITSLKRKFSSSDSSDESVGGPVDVAIITKGDGFIWMKRKQYFDIDNNKGFMDKYFKH